MTLPHRAISSAPIGRTSGQTSDVARAYLPERRSRWPPGPVGRQGAAASDRAPLPPGGRSSAAGEIARLLPRSPVMKGFDTVFAGVMTAPEPERDGQPIARFAAGDDEGSRATVMALADDAGFAPPSGGSTKNARHPEAVVPLDVAFAGGGSDAAFVHHRRPAARPAGAGCASTDDEWTRLGPPLPVRWPGRGRPAIDRRRAIDALLRPARTRAPWRALPGRFGPRRMIATRLSRRTASGPWGRAVGAGRGGGPWGRAVGADRGRPAPAGGSRREPRSAPARDRRHHRAHPSARGGRRRGRPGQALGRSRGGFSAGIHLRRDGEGRPLVLHPTGGERHDQAGLEALLSGLAIERPRRGRPSSRPHEPAADRGCTGAPVRGEPRRRGIRAVVPTRPSETRRLTRDRAAHAERCLIDRLEPHRPIATRHDKRARTPVALAFRCRLGKQTLAHALMTEARDA